VGRNACACVLCAGGICCEGLHSHDRHNRISCMSISWSAYQDIIFPTFPYICCSSPLSTISPLPHFPFICLFLLLLHVKVENCLTTKAVASEQYAEEVKVMKAAIMHHCPHVARWGLGSNKVRRISYLLSMLLAAAACPCLSWCRAYHLIHVLQRVSPDSHVVTHLPPLNLFRSPHLPPGAAGY
jgi:hypothetical protein